MKLAIIGGGPCAIEAALHFEQLGACVLLFSERPLAHRFKEFVQNGSADLISEQSHKTSSIGRKIAGIEESDLNFHDYGQKYLNSLIEHLESRIEIRYENVIRVQKRFKSRGDSEKRMGDLFRIVSLLEGDPEGLEWNGPEEQIKNIKSALQGQWESFQDVDLVIDASGFTRSPLPLGSAQAPALGENLLDGEQVDYDLCIGKGPLDQSGDVAVIGDGIESAYAFSHYYPQLQKRDGKTFFISSSESPFSGFLVGDHPLASSISENLAEEGKKIKASWDQFENETISWRDSGRPGEAPAEPEFKLNFLTGVQVSSIDKLSDREGLFLTLENAQSVHQTIKVDKVWSLNGYQKEPQFDKFLAENEPGFYSLRAIDGNLDVALDSLDEIEKDVLNYFSRKKD